MTYLELFDVRGKTALVTGARKGIGFAIASALAEHGANLIVVSSQQTPNDELSRSPQTMESPTQLLLVTFETARKH